MRRFSPTSFALAVPATLVAQMAWADLTPADVWGDWQQYMEGMGYTVTATQSADGDTLTVSDISFGMQIPDNQGDMQMEIGTMQFQQQSDGTVAVILPDSMPMSMNMTPPEGQGAPVQMSMTITQTGHTMVASGSPEQIISTYAADTMGIILNQIVVEGTTMGDEAMQMNMLASDVSNITTMTGQGETRGYDQRSTVSSVTYEMVVAPPDEPATVNMQGEMQTLAFETKGTVPNTLTNVADMSAMIAAGFDVKGSFTYGSGQTAIAVEDPQSGEMAFNTSSDGGTLGVEMGEAGLAYLVEQTNTKVSAKVSNLPFPVDLSMAKTAFNLMMPVSPSDDPQDFAFGLTMGDFEMSDMIWGIFDPTSQLPRDPATIALDLTGTAKMFIDFLNPESAAMMATQTPGELETLKMNNLVVDLAGARLDGSGDFTFDNTDTTTFPGMPKPVGEVNLSLVGGNGLMDKLVAMGLLPQDQAMGARMMMGLFAVPGDAPDSLSSKIEFNEEGQVLANGQRIQ